MIGYKYTALRGAFDQSQKAWNIELPMQCQHFENESIGQNMPIL